MSFFTIWRRYDWLLFGTMALLIVFGVLMIRSATLGAIDPDIINRVPNQIRYAFIGLAVMMLLTILDYRVLGSINVWLYLLMLGLLLLVPFFGTVGDAGARRWLNLGILIQPSEIGKLVIIITLGHFLATHKDRMGNLWTVARSLLLILPPVGLIFIQPDLGTTIVFFVIWAIMLWGGGLRLAHIGMVLLALVLAFPLLWSQMEEYQRDRITTFISPESDPDSFYNIRQARISIGNGGLFGLGYANGTQGQLRFLRVRHTDFIFSQIAEEFGFVGGVGVMLLIGVVIARILRGAHTASDALGALICYGVAANIFFQSFVSIGMNLSLLPVTGLTLPFISSGGTSLMAVMASIGLAQSVIVRRRAIA